LSQFWWKHETLITALLCGCGVYTTYHVPEFRKLLSTKV
jgi:hypothetical protein